MINAKMKIFRENTSYELESSVNKFLETIDIRQIVNTKYSSHGDNYSSYYSCLIFYVGIDDIRDSKIDTVFDGKR